MRHKLKHFHLQGLRSRYMGEDNILVAASSFSECDRLIRGAVSAAIPKDWQCIQGTYKTVGLVDLRRKKLLSDEDQEVIRSCLMIPDTIPAPAGENPVKALHRYMRQATANTNRRLVVIVPLDAFTVENTSLPLLLSLGRQHGIRFICALTPHSCVAKKSDLQSVISACGVEVLGPDLEIKLGITPNEVEAYKVKNAKTYCVFSSRSRMAHENEKRRSLSKMFGSWFPGLKNAGTGTVTSSQP